MPFAGLGWDGGGWGTVMRVPESVCSPFLGLQSWLSNRSPISFLDGLKPYAPSPKNHHFGTVMALVFDCVNPRIPSGTRKGKCIANRTQLVMESPVSCDRPRERQETRGLWTLSLGLCKDMLFNALVFYALYSHFTSLPMSTKMHGLLSLRTEWQAGLRTRHCV